MNNSMTMMMLCTLLATFVITTNSAATTPKQLCPFAVKALSSCMPYLTNKEEKAVATCCIGVKGVKQMGHAKELCVCLKDFAKSTNGIDFKRANALPGLCSVSLPFSISPDVDDCSSLK